MKRQASRPDLRFVSWSFWGMPFNPDADVSRKRHEELSAPDRSGRGGSYDSNSKSTADECDGETPASRRRAL
jgi:hypothetical protein